MLARPYREFSFEYEVEDYPHEAQPQATEPESQQVLNEYSYPESSLYVQQHPQQQAQRGTFHERRPHQHEGLQQLSQGAHLLRQQQRQQQQQQQTVEATSAHPQASLPYEIGAPADFSHGRRKRRRQQQQQQEQQEEYRLDLEGLDQPQVPLELTPGGHHARPQPVSMGYQSPLVQASQLRQHHHLPAERVPRRLRRSDYAETGLPPPPPPPPQQQHHHHHHQSSLPPASLVGQEGMPQPAPKPRGPKLKFTPEDDRLLTELKEKKSLTWKQIAEFFPGRSSGTLQVRYCTKLKAKTTAWTDETVEKLRKVMREYENDRWRIISGKVGSGFTPSACKEKAEELEALEMAVEQGDDEDDEGEGEGEGEPESEEVAKEVGVEKEAGLGQDEDDEGKTQEAEDEEHNDDDDVVLHEHEQEADDRSENEEIPEEGRGNSERRGGRWKHAGPGAFRHSNQGVSRQP